MTARSGFTVSGSTTITSTWGNGVRDHIIPRTTTNDVSAEGQLAVNTSTNQIVIHDGTSAVQFGGYGTPAAITSAFFSQTGYVASSVSVAGEYTRYGNHWVCNGSIAINSVSSGGTAGNLIGFFVSDLPAVTTTRCVGSFVFLTTGGAAVYGGGLLMVSGSNVMNLYHGGTNGIGISPSVGLGAGDTIWFSINYHDI